MKPVVLIVLEAPEQRAIFNQSLHGSPYRAVFASDGEDGFDRVREVQPDLVLAHLHTTRIDGTILCQLVRQETQGQVPVVLFGAARAYDGHAQQRAESVGARAFLALEDVGTGLLDAIEHALTQPAPEKPAPRPGSSGATAATRAPSVLQPPAPEEAPFQSGTQDVSPIEEAGEDMPTSLTAAPEDLRRALAEAAEAPPSEPTPPPSARAADMLDEPPLPMSGLGPARPIGSGSATGRSRNDDLIQELPREVTPSASAPGVPGAPGVRSLAAPASRQRKGLDESQLGKRLVRRVHQVHQLLEHLDYYQLLGVEPHATAAQLRAAYFELSLEFHPDRFFLLRSGDIKAKIYAIFRHVSEAYAVLADERRREVYDEQRELRRGPAPTPAAPPLAAPTPARGFDLRGPEVRPSSLDPRLQTPELRLDGVTTHAGARRYVQLAQVALKQDDLDQARLLLGLAVGLDTMNVSLRRVLEGVSKRRARQVRARFGEAVSSGT